MIEQEDLLYKLETLASYDKEDLDYPEFDVVYEDQNGGEHWTTVCCIELAKQAEERIKSLEKQLQKAIIQRDESYRQEDLLLEENKELRRKRFSSFNTEAGEDSDYWKYSLGDNNYLHSLICPVLVSSDDMRHIMRTLHSYNMWSLEYLHTHCRGQDNKAEGEKVLNLLNTARAIVNSSNLYDTKGE